MRVRLLESANGIREGEIRDLDEVSARELIIKGVAIRIGGVGERAVDAEAYEALRSARDRDEEQSR